MIRTRCVIVGIVLGLVICAVTPFNNMYLAATPLGGGHFPLAPFFILILVTLAAALASRLFFRKKPVLTGLELLVSWGFMVVVSGIAFTGLARTFFINVTASTHFATVGNRWKDILTPLVPKAWMPSDPAAVETLYNGLEGGYRQGWLEVLANIPWAAWTRPLAAWGVFVLLCYLVMVCLVNLFSRQWISNERMNFPLLRVPAHMTEAYDQGQAFGFFTDRYLLLGLCVPVLLHVINGIGFYDPAVPQIPTLFLIGPYFPSTGFFSGFNKLRIYFYPAFIGFAYLTARQISLSFWVFYLIGGLLFGLFEVIGYQIPSSALGVTFGPTLTRPDETQMIGAYGVFFLFIVWLARQHLFMAVRDAVTFRRAGAAESEWMSAGLSFWGFLAGMVLLVCWCAYFGMSVAPALLLLGIFFVIMLVATRIICQGGLAYFTLTAAPTDGLLAFFGSGFFSNIGLMMAAIMQKVLFVDLRESLMPSLMHLSKIGENVRQKRLLLGGLGGALVLAVAVSFAAMLVLCHKYGLRDLQVDWETQTTVGVYENVQRLLEAPSGSNEWIIGFAVAGAVVMLVLVICYQRFYWWPIHPVGYLTMYSSAMRILWFSFFVGWMCNQLTLRYGGVALFRRVRMLFVGLIIGDFLMGGIYAVIGIYAGQSYLVLPN